MSFQTFQKKSCNSKLREKYYINGKTHVDTEKNNLYFIFPWKLMNGGGVGGGGSGGGGEGLTASGGSGKKRKFNKRSPVY